jgi:hypothetical protein
MLKIMMSVAHMKTLTKSSVPRNIENFRNGSITVNAMRLYLAQRRRDNILDCQAHPLTFHKYCTIDVGCRNV